MTGVKTEGTAGAMVPVLSKKRDVAASGTVAALIMVSFHVVSHLGIARKFARNIRAGLPCWLCWHYISCVYQRSTPQSCRGVSALSAYRWLHLSNQQALQL